MTDHEDPGWAPAVRRGPFVILLPFAHVGTMRTLRKGGLDGLSVLRMLFLHFVFALFSFLAVLLLVVGGQDLKPIPGWMAVAFPALLLGCLVGVGYAPSRRLDLSDESALVRSTAPCSSWALRSPEVRRCGRSSPCSWSGACSPT